MTDQNEMIAAVLQCKYAQVDVVVVPIIVDDAEMGHAVGEFFQNAYQLAPRGMTDTEINERWPRQPHLLGLIANGKKFAMTLHFQPERDAEDFCAPPFTVSVAVQAVGLQQVDVFAMGKPGA